MPCCSIFSRLPRSVSVSSSISARVFSSNWPRCKRLLQLVEQLGGERREVVDEIERVLDLVGDAGGQLAQRGELLGLHQAVLRGLQILQRLRQFAGAGFDALEQPHVLDRDHGLVGEGRDQFDLLVGERPHLCARKCRSRRWLCPRAASERQAWCG